MENKLYEQTFKENYGHKIIDSKTFWMMEAAMDYQKTNTTFERADVQNSGQT